MLTTSVMSWGQHFWGYFCQKDSKTVLVDHWGKLGSLSSLDSVSKEPSAHKAWRGWEQGSEAALMANTHCQSGRRLKCLELPPHLLFNPFSFEISTSFLNLDLERTVQICCEGSAVTLQKAFWCNHQCFPNDKLCHEKEFAPGRFSEPSPVQSCKLRWA